MFFGGLFALALLGFFAPKAMAMTPTLSLYSIGNRGIQITVNGDPNLPVYLYYYPNNNGSITSTSLGSTNSSGYLSTTVDASAYNIGQNSSVYVTVDGIQSNTESWPYNNNGYYGNIYLSQSSLYLNSGQSQSVSVSGGNGSYYISSNSNSGVASASISGNEINVYGYYSGNTTVTVCSNSSNSGCVTLYVTVNGNNVNYNQTSVTLTQNSVSLAVGQSESVGIYGGTGIYYISSNPNQYVASVGLSGSSLQIYGIQNGSSVVTVCSSIANTNNNNQYYNNTNNGGYVYNSCANLVVTVSQNYVYNNNYVPPVTPVSGQYSSGVFLSQVPYTGVDSNSGFVLFVIGLWIWSAIVTYFIVSRMKNSPQAVSTESISAIDRIKKFKKENLAKRLK